MIRPTNNAATYCKQKNIVAMTRWVNLHDEDVYIHGPFNFAIHGPFNFAHLNGRKTMDRISPTDWKILDDMRQKYDNEPPKISNQIMYTYCVDERYHETTIDKERSKEIQAYIGQAYLLDEVLF